MLCRAQRERAKLKKFSIGFLKMTNLVFINDNNIIMSPFLRRLCLVNIHKIKLIQDVKNTSRSLITLCLFMTIPSYK